VSVDLLLTEVKAAEKADAYGRPGEGACSGREMATERGRYSFYGHPGTIRQQVRDSGQGRAGGRL
jgi:hypothetical protein